MFHSRIICKTVLAFVSAVFVFCGSCLRAEEKQLIIASPHWEGVQYEFERAFTDYYLRKTGNKVHFHWRDLGGTSQIQKAINAAYKVNPDSCGIDLFFGGGMDPLEDQKRLGHLQAYQLPEEIAGEIPATLGGIIVRDPEGYYFGAALSSFGIVENLKVISLVGLPKVESWEDLCQPELVGWVSSAEPRKSGSVHMIYEIILQALGWEKGWQVIYRMSGNVKLFLDSSSAPTKEVSSGEVAYAISIDLNGMVQQSFIGSDKVRFIIPSGESMINPDGIAILKGAPHADVAREFVNFVLSIHGQKLWMTPTGETGGPAKFNISRMSVLPSLYEQDLSKLLVPLNPFQTTFSLQYNNKLGSKRWGIVNDLIGATVIDVHPSLIRAWKAIIALPPEKRVALLKEFDTPPVTEEQASELAKLWRDDKLKARKISNEWTTQAAERYKRIEKAAKELKRP